MQFDLKEATNRNKKSLPSHSFITFNLVKYLYIFILFFLMIPTESLISQSDHPDKTELFRDDVVARVDIIINEELLDGIFNGDLTSNELRPATFIFDNGSVKDTLKNVGFRLRGNTSRNADKQSFKIDLNAFESGRKYFGVQKINLNGQHNDPTISRAKICADMAEWLGVPSMRTNHVRLYINNEYRGLYTNVEHIDQQFVKKRFDNKNGNLYKCLYPADLAYKGSDSESYKEIIFDRRAYDLKTNKELDDYTDLALFIDVLNNTPPNEMQCALEKVFNVDAYLRAMVFDILTGNWDGPIYNQNNFYLYNNEKTGLMEYIPYDLDNTLGIDWVNRDWGERNIYAWKQSGAQRPIYSKIMGVSVYRVRFTHYMKDAIETFFTSGHLHTYIDDLKNLLLPFVENDPFYPLDYGFDIDDFRSGFNGSLPFTQTDYGIRSYIEKRSKTALDQLNDNDLPITYSRINVNRPNTEELFAASIKVDNTVGLQSVELCYYYGSDSETCIAMLDDGTQNDQNIDDGIYGVSLPAYNVPSTFTYRFKAKDFNNLVTFYPNCGHKEVLIEESSPKIVINEFLASNSSIITDTKGEYDDWIELYNNGDYPIYLGNKYLTDNQENQNKWSLPFITLSPDEYLLIWADDDRNQGSNHSNFQLKASGEYIGIYNKESTDIRLIDEIIYEQQGEDISYGRLPNGEGGFVKLIPTPNAKNEIETSLTNPIGYQISVYPNPVKQFLHIDNENFNVAIIEVLDPIGAKTTLKYNANGTDVSQLSTGIYFIKIQVNDNMVYSGKFFKL